MALALIRKLSTKTLLGGKPRVVEGQRKFLYQLAGIARGLKKGESNFGPYTEFRGDFAALIADDNGTLGDKGFRAPRAFFPEPFSGMLEASIQEQIDANATEKSRATAAKQPFIEQPVEAVFKVNVYAKHDAQSSVGYTYEVEPVVDVSTSDRVTGLLEAGEGEYVTPAGDIVDNATGEVKKKGGKKHHKK